VTVTTDAAHFERAIGRMRVLMLSLSGAGAVAVWHFKGWAWALGFLAGAAASLLNFRWLHQLVASLGEGGRSPRKRLLLFLSLRYLLLGLFGYVIVVYFRLNLAAALMGLFVPVAAVILEILYELLYART
jgi:hypothetical protein